MDTQGERQNYQWRPNDNSSTTLTRYDQEVEHWYKAFKSAEMKHKSSSFSETMGVIGLVISLVGNLIVLIALGLIQFVKWLIS